MAKPWDRKNPDDWADSAAKVNNQADDVADDPKKGPTYETFATIITDQANLEHDAEGRGE